MTTAKMWRTALLGTFIILLVSPIILAGAIARYCYGAALCGWRLMDEFIEWIAE